MTVRGRVWSNAYEREAAGPPGRPLSLALYAPRDPLRRTGPGQDAGKRRGHPQARLAGADDHGKLYLLRVEDRLVGVTTYCERPPEAARKEKSERDPGQHREGLRPPARSRPRHIAHGGWGCTEAEASRNGGRRLRRAGVVCGDEQSIHRVGTDGGKGGAGA